MKMRFYTLIIPLAFTMLNCGSTKDTQSQNGSSGNETVVEKKAEDETTEEATDKGGLGMAEGIVKNLDSDGCGFVIEVLMDNVSNESTLLEPLELPEAYRIGGKPIKFTYRMSRRVSKCTQANPIVIEEILG